MTDNKVTHKELLSFANLTNLSWEFVDLEAIKNGDHSYVAGTSETDDETSTQLNDLLTPEVFVRYDTENDMYHYLYPEDKFEEEINYTDEQMNQGLIEMRQEAGIAMEYLEKEEGDFLKDWEVIYAADNYKLIEDYLDILHELFSDFYMDDVWQTERERLQGRFITELRFQ